MLNKIRNVSGIVYYLLARYPEMRDNDRQLMLNVWLYQNPDLLCEAFISFATTFKKGKYFDPESIRRARQKLQELNPNLRGATYEERHKKESDMRGSIKDLVMP